MIQFAAESRRARESAPEFAGTWLPGFEAKNKVGVQTKGAHVRGGGDGDDQNPLESQRRRSNPNTTMKGNNNMISIRDAVAISFALAAPKLQPWLSERIPTAIRDRPSPHDPPQRRPCGEIPIRSSSGAGQEKRPHLSGVAPPQ